jgi:hypothetical protein
MARRSRKFRPSMHMLEERATPALFGVPWSDSSHLTVSFAPDGTTALNQSSSLHASLDPYFPNSEWQTILLHAIQTWSEVANLNIGFIQDSGTPFGSPGVPQGDSRFGDIRIGAVPMTDVLATAIPPDPILVDTLAGDIFLNTRSGFDPLTLYGVALHEVGHALGLGNSSDPLSVMHAPFDYRTSLSESDIAAIRSLYSPRRADMHEGRRGNENFNDATRIRYGDWFDGSAPLVIFGDMTTRSDVDNYSISIKEDFSGPLKVRLQTEGISLLAAKLSIFDSQGNLIESRSGAGAKGDTIALTLPHVREGEKYYLKVEPADASVFSVGRYGLAVSFEDLLTVDEETLESVLRGPYDHLSTRQIARLLLEPPGSTTDEGESNDTFRTATELDSISGFPENSQYRVTASISDVRDIDFYEFESPSTANGQTLVLTATVRAIGPNGAAQRIELFDSRQNRIPSTILTNGNGTFTIQAAGLSQDRDFYVRVGGGGAGDYRVDLRFSQSVTPLSTFANGTIHGVSPIATTLFIAETMVFGFAFSSTGPVSGTPVIFSIHDSVGNEVFSMTGATGDTLSGLTGFLPPGEYRARIRAVGSTAPIGFQLIGSSVSDPIGPQISDSSAPPLYVDPWDPEYYLYPTGAVSLDPYLWVYWSIE